MPRARYVIPVLGILVVLAAVVGPLAGAQQVETSVEIEASPTDYEASEATHTVEFTVGQDAASAGEQFDDVLIDYEPGAEPADVSNVDPEAIQWIGIDRGGNNTGTRVDEEATVVEVSTGHDGQALFVETAGELTLDSGDEVVVVYQGVQNPQDQGQATDSEVAVTLNPDGSADEASGPVRYEWNNATVSMPDQETSGEMVIVEEVTLSEDGFVVVQNESGEYPDEIRGGVYLDAGEHENVAVEVDPPVSSNTELYAQAYLDTNGDHNFQYDGGLVDRPFETQDGNVMAVDPAEISHTGDGSTTPTATETTPTETETSTSTEEGDEGTATDAEDTTEETDPETDDTETEDVTIREETVDGGDADADGPGFGTLAGVIALLVASMLARRR